MALFGRGLSQGGGGASSGGGVSSSITSLQTQIDEINEEITIIQGDISDFDTDGFIEVFITDLQEDDVISWNGVEWVNAPLGDPSPLALDDLTDVTVPTPSDKDILMWDQGSMLWINHQPTKANTPGRVVRRDDNGDIDVRILTATTVTTTNLTLTNVPANLVPSVRSLATTAPLRIDGGASADLSANRTLSINVFAGSTPGSVPTSPGGETLFLNADGDWVSPEGTAGAATVSAIWAVDGQGVHLEGADSTGELVGTATVVDTDSSQANLRLAITLSPTSDLANVFNALEVRVDNPLGQDGSATNQAVRSISALTTINGGGDYYEVAAVYAATIFVGDGDTTWVNALTASAELAGDGDSEAVYAGYFHATHVGAGTVIDMAGLWVGAPSGTATNNYGLIVEDIAGGTNNFAIKTASGAVSFGDRVYVASPASAPDDADIANGQVSQFQDEGNDYLEWRGKESGGTAHTWILGAGGLGAGQLDTIPFTFDAGSGNLLTARSSWKQMKFAGSMTDWTMTSDASDTFGFTITKCAYADFDTFSAITGGTVPALSAVKKNTGTDNAGVTFAAGDFVKVTLTGSPASASQGRLDIGYKRT